MTAWDRSGAGAGARVMNNNDGPAASDEVEEVIMVLGAS
jgi:hypothetical protein